MNERMHEGQLYDYDYDYGYGISRFFNLAEVFSYLAT